MTQFSDILKRLFVAVLISLLLIFFIHDRVHAGDLQELPSFQFEQAPVDEASCESFVQKLGQVRDHLALTAQVLEDYLRLSSASYFEWHQHLASLENVPHKWDVGSFRTLFNASQTLNEAKDLIYEISVNDEEFFYQVAAVLEDAECFGAVDPDRHAAWIEEFYRLMQYNSEHISTAGEFVSRMSKRLAVAASDWQKLEKIEAQTLPAGYFSRLQVDAEIFSEAAKLTGSNGRYVSQQFELFRSQIADQLMPLAPGLGAR
jgi:hypothetical protein